MFLELYMPLMRHEQSYLGVHYTHGYFAGTTLSHMLFLVLAQSAFLLQVQKRVHVPVFLCLGICVSACLLGCKPTWPAHLLCPGLPRPGPPRPRPAPRCPALQQGSPAGKTGGVG